LFTTAVLSTAERVESAGAWAAHGNAAMIIARARPHCFRSINDLYCL